MLKKEEDRVTFKGRNDEINHTKTAGTARNTWNTHKTQQTNIKHDVLESVLWFITNVFLPNNCRVTVMVNEINYVY